MVITTKIKELQYYTKFNEIFVLSILIMVTNLGAKALSGALAGRGEHIKKKRGTFMKKWKKAATLGMTAMDLKENTCSSPLGPLSLAASCWQRGPT